MERISLPFFSSLGANLSKVALFQYSPQFRTLLVDYVYRLSLMLRMLIESSIALRVCRQACINLIVAAGEVIEHYNRNLPDTQKDDPELDGKFSNIVVQALQFEVVLNAELDTLHTYHITQKAAYDTTSLIDKAEDALPPSTLKKIGADVVKEVQEAGRCLVFDCATASGFHILRAVELVMHQFYVVVCEPNSKQKLKDWGAYISTFKKLVEAETTGKSIKDSVKKVMALLQQVKNQDRNLIMHPEVVLSPDDALKLFALAQATINAMAPRLKVSNKTER